MLHSCWLFLLWSFGFGGEKIGLRHLRLPSLQKQNKTKPHMYMTETIVAVLGPRERRHQQSQHFEEYGEDMKWMRHLLGKAD